MTSRYVCSKFLLLLGVGFAGCSLFSSQSESLSDKIVVEEGECGTRKCLEVIVEPLVVSGLEPEVMQRVQDAVNTLLLTDVSDGGVSVSPTQFAQGVAGDYVAAKKASGLQEVWQIHRIAKVLFENDSVLTVAVVRNEQTGGVHPTDLTTYLSFDKATGQQLGIRQLLQPGKEKLLQKLMTFELRKHREISPGESLREAGFTVDDESSSLIDMATFAIVENGVLVHYNPYQIAPYALGPTEFSLSPHSSVAVFRRDSPYLTHMFSGATVVR